MEFGKLENSVFKRPPARIIVDGRIVTDPTASTLIQAGYLPVVETPVESVDGHVPIPVYMEENGVIYRGWRYEPVSEAPEEEYTPTDADRLDALEANQELIAELLMGLLG